VCDHDNWGVCVCVCVCVTGGVVCWCVGLGVINYKQAFLIIDNYNSGNFLGEEHIAHS